MMLCVCFSYVDNSTNFSLVERLKATEDLNLVLLTVGFVRNQSEIFVR